MCNYQTNILFVHHLLITLNRTISNNCTMFVMRVGFYAYNVWIVYYLLVLFLFVYMSLHCMQLI